MRPITFLLIISATLTIFAKEDPEHLKSRVYFYKNVSKEEIKGWEKDFFKDLYEEEPMSIPDADIVAENETDDNDAIKIKLAPRIRKLPKIRKIQAPQPAYEKPDNEIPASPDVEKEIPETDIYEKPDIQTPAPEQKRKKPLSLNEIIPETEDEDTETPDNEVDRSSRIRKMKKLLKKRKGKSRIDKRF